MPVEVDRTSKQTIAFSVEQLIPSEVADYTTDALAFALTPGRLQTVPRQRPTDDSWGAGYWITTPGLPLAAFDFGSTDELTAGPGYWTIWIRITDDPDIVVQQQDTLRVS